MHCVNSDPELWQRQPGHGKYARPERERRFLLAAEPPPGAADRRIEDRYIAGTRLRLRHVADGTDVAYKLTQKVRARGDNPAEGWITNVYLSPEEHALLATLPARTISKTRSVHAVGGHDFVVDVFHGRLRGLRLAEIEVDDLHAPLPIPTWIGQEVTQDDRYSGGFLASALDEQVADLLAH